MQASSLIARLGPRRIGLFLGAAAFLAAFAWLVATRGPLAPVGVETATVDVADLSPEVFGIGTVEARQAYAVGPTQAGRVLRVWVDQGDTVQAGQLLAEIDPVDLAQRAEAAASTAARARQAAQSAQAQIAEAESRARIADASLARYQALLQQKFVAQEMVDIRSHEAAAARAALAAARANAAAAARDVGRADAEVRVVERQSRNLRLTSPLGGVVVAREAEPGTTVVAGQAVLRLVDPAGLWVRARIDQARAAGLSVGQAAAIVLRSAPGVSLPGRVARIDLQSDALTEERIVNVVFDPVPPRLYLGELAEISIRLPVARAVPAIPRAALVRHDGRTGVWRIEAGRARFQPVRTGIETDDRVQVVSGLTAGERVIAYSTNPLAEGVRVREQKLSER